MVTEPLLLVPPMMCNAGVYLHQIADLSNDMPVIFAPTHHGERMEEIASTILGWAPPKFAIAGLGMGGMVAMEILRRAPNRVMRIAFIDTSAQADTPEYSSGREALIVAARSGRFQDVINTEMTPEILAPGPGRSELSEFITEMALAMGPAAYVRQARAMQRRKDQQATLRKITQPALVMCGEHDTLNPVRRQKFIAELIPNARLEVIANAGHLPTLEQPEAVNAQLRRWMKEPLILR